MSSQKRSVLISGCSQGGMGAALAKEFHARGYQVYATARSTDKMAELADEGIKTLQLDIVSEESIQDCVNSIPKLDILVNNAAVMHTSAITDLPIQEAKEIFNANVWGHLSLIQACLPLLLKSDNAMIVNHTSVGTAIAIPFQSVYNASKAALAMFSDTLRLELHPFDIKIIELKTGGVKTNVLQNLRPTKTLLPNDSIYNPARDLMERSLRREGVDELRVPAEQWARQVVGDLEVKSPASHIYRGELAWMGKLIPFLPFWMFAGMVKKMTFLDRIEQTIRQ